MSANRERGTAEVVKRKAIRREPLQLAMDEAAVNLAKFEVKSGQEYMIAESLYEAARLDFESYDFERDATGAWKGESLGVDLKGIYEHLAGEDRVLDVRKAEGLHLIQVNMGELDRINKVYGHRKGDEALGNTCQRIYGQLEEILGEMVRKKTGAETKPQDLERHFDVYRTAGNDFTVLLHDVDAETASRIRQTLSGKLSFPGLKPGDEGVPLSATHVPLAESAEYFNEQSSIIAGQNPGRAFVDVVKEEGQILNDMEKNNQRVARILEIKDQGEAKDLYENFLKKTLSRMFSSKPMSYEEFRKALEDSKDDGLESAIGLAIQDFRARRRESRGTSDLLSNFVLERKRRELKEAKGVDIKTDEILALDAELEGGGGGERAEIVEYKEFLGENKVLTGEETEDEVRVIPTNGEKELAELRNDMVRLSKLVESCQQMGDDPECPQYEARAKAAKARFHNAEVKRNPATGLYERGMFFQDIKSALKEGEPVTVISIDMAFLKYFDKEGGLKTGNAAIKVAARILDGAIGQFKVAAESYRLGGDEFGLVLGTVDPQMVQAIQNKIRDLALQTPIPPLDEARTAQYQEERIQFNFGVYSAQDMASMREELRSGDVPLKARESDEAAVLEESAQYLFMVADRQLEIEKTIERFMFLANRYFKEKPEGKGYMGNYAVLEDYSDKAIGGQDGRDKIKEWAAKYTLESPDGAKVLDAAALRREVTKHVISTVEKTSAQEENEGAKEDRLLESMAKARFLTQRIENLQAQVGILNERLKTAERNGDTMHQQIRSLEAEIVQIRDLRGNIRQAA